MTKSSYYIRKKLRELGLDLKDLAKYWGTTPNAMRSLIRRGPGRLQARNLQKMADAFGLTVGQLYTEWSEALENEGPQEKEEKNEDREDYSL